MPKLSQKTNLIILLVCFISVIFFLFKSFNANPKIVYVDNNKLFENFNMTKELKRLGEKEFNAKKSKADFLYKKLQSSDFSISEKEILSKEFIQSKDDLEQFNQIFALEQSSKIWVRIKSYSVEFAKENKYELVIGSDNTTNVLFADENIDVTKQLITYINKKYEGFK